MWYYPGFARSYTTCRNYAIFVTLGHIITHTEQPSYYATLLLIISSFSVSDVTDEYNIYLGLFSTLLLARLIATYSS